ncbi:hypothetical protein TorRG33x02_068410 [Trema orientale]|uniref:Transmembrane protein n=1 Tax=Trema orientale TaxID=63057 RepID=A0A2P5FHW7_TREOI|nr:hypothetical protein TorRG33x02_068410 [Trema orientale]
MDDDERRKGKNGQIGFLEFVAAYLFQVIMRLFIVVLWSPKVRVEIHVSPKRPKGISPTRLYGREYVIRPGVRLS